MDGIRERARILLVLAALGGAAPRTLAAGGTGTDEQAAIEAIAARVRPSVVEVIGTLAGTGDTSYGTGFVFGEPGLVVTNAHVVRGVRNLVVRTFDGVAFASVEVLDQRDDVDLAVLRVRGLDAEPLPGGSTELPPVGLRVIAVGHPRGYDYTVSDGIVSATRALEEGGQELIQVTAPISPGSSGGPLLDLSGRVIGICSLTLTEGQNINFAVPLRDLGPVLAEAREIERSLADPDPAHLGAHALAEIARRYREDGDLERAGDLVQRALAVHPRSLDLLAEAAEVAWARQSWPEVRALVDRMKALDPAWPPALQVEASWLAQQGRCEEAVRAAEASLVGGRLRPAQAAEAHAVLAECLGRLGRVEEALAHADLALASPEIDRIPDYHALRAFLLQAAGRDAEADREAVTALERAEWDPVVVAALRERGLPRVVRVVTWKVLREGSRTVVRGILRNVGPTPLEEVVVTAEGYDAEGTTIATGTATASPERLNPGQAGAFRVVLDGLPGEAKRFSVRIVDYHD